MALWQIVFGNHYGNNNPVIGCVCVVYGKAKGTDIFQCLHLGQRKG